MTSFITWKIYISILSLYIRQNCNSEQSNDEFESLRGKSDKTKPAYTLYTQALKRPQTKSQKHSAENQKTNKTRKQSMHNNSYRGRYRRWREALLKNKTISEEDDAFLSGYQKWMCTLQTRGVIATPNCYLIIQSLYTVPVILQVVQFLYLPDFWTFLRLNQRRMKWPSFLLGGTFEKKRPTKFSMHKKRGGV